MDPDPVPSSPPVATSTRRNLALFGLLCVAAVGGVVAYALYSRRPAPQPTGSIPTAATVSEQTLAEVRRRPHLLFRNTALGQNYGRLMVAALDAPEAARYATPLSCDRVYGTSEGGLCLQASRGVFTTYQAVGFDRDFRIMHTFKVAGVPSRTRVSRDGRRGAVTVFVTGDSYSAAGFSTRTTIYELDSGRLIGDLEEFAVRKEGQPFKEVDFNFWGVTFASDGDRFYATLTTGGRILLVEGRVSLRELTVLREAVECPSLSPDGTRLVFKSRTMEGGRLIWRLKVLDLGTGTETTLNETRSVDDQSEWLDNRQVLYALSRGVPGSGTSDIWVARVDGSVEPRVFAHDATSPCVVRP